jgi:hypothetical protein
MEKPKSCLRCKHYYSTFDPNQPRGCRLYGFRSARFPSMIVKAESGNECQGFSEKKKQSESKERDLNDPRYW